jgi:hypothetical protein
LYLAAGTMYLTCLWHENLRQIEREHNWRHLGFLKTRVIFGIIYVWIRNNWYWRYFLCHKMMVMCNYTRLQTNKIWM